MKLIPVAKAVGMVLSHDVTEIVPGRFKGPAFKRGHVIQPEDVDRLRDLGKENIAALDLGPGWVHEDDAA
ncbi:MAG: molybdopterin-binding protein, partial [Desulfobacterales bacterium]